MYLLSVLTPEEVNGLISEHFIKIFGNVVEHCPAAAIRVLKNRPFKDALDIYKAISAYLESLSLKEKEKILLGHTDVVASLADLSRLFLDFDQKRRVDDVYKLTIEDKQKLGDLNRKYKEKFGFPFVISSKKSNILTIIEEMEKRIENSHEEEIDRSMQEVMKISKLRIFEIVQR